MEIMIIIKEMVKEKNIIVNEDLFFEGEYLNGERNGKGKEYQKGKLYFEGIFNNGKIWNGNEKNIVMIN